MERQSLRQIGSLTFIIGNDHTHIWIRDRHFFLGGDVNREGFVFLVSEVVNDADVYAPHVTTSSTSRERVIFHDRNVITAICVSERRNIV